MGFKTASLDLGAGKRQFKSPLKLRHIWIPLAFLLVVLYRNQRISNLSLAEASVGIGIAFLSFLPLFIWASSKNREFPAFQSFCAVHFPFYAYPILTSKVEYLQFKESDRLTAGVAVLLMLSLAILVYYAGRNRLGAKRPAGVLQYREISDESARVFFTFLLLAWAVYMVVLNFGLVNFGSAKNVVAAFFSGAGMLAGWTLCRQIGERTLGQVHTMFVIGTLTVALLICLASGSLIYGLTMLIVCVASYGLVSSRVPWTTIILVIGFVAFLNLGKAEMRRIYWHRGAPILSVGKIIEIYETWIPASWRALAYGENHNEDKKVQSLLDRANLIQVLTKVIHLTPERQPFLWGETYADTPILLVPRPLWRNKPHGHISTVRLGLYYGLTTQGESRTTTVAVGQLAEAWANFGWAGIIGFAVIIGAMMRYVANGCADAHPASIHRLLSIVWMAHSFQVELVTSSWIVSLLQTTAAMLVLVYPVSRSVSERSMRPVTSYSTA